ncbi:sensor histidine kinase [Carboxylicivirga caseinilyticus]|uniref:sensor histidine kinase n=1 Tax=Carboxylicivirga caseinilyticus TaxID=3417572 RepID=UPI003D339C96|nr:HAMP domain-containing histidine kinase [Marinilabiliaceae bacterium A049]
MYNNQKNYQKALEHALLKQAYGDSLEKKNQENIIERLRTEQSYGEQQRILETTEKSNIELASKQQKLLILSISTIILLIICVVVLLENRLKQIKNKELLVQVKQINDYQKKLLSIIGHDLRDSVGNMKNFTELMHYNLLENKSINQMVTKFVPMVNSTYDLLNNLLFWSKNNSKNFTPQYESVSNLKLISETIKHVDHLAKAKEIEIVEMVDEAKLECDKNMLLTILRNLLSNAIKFSYPNSKIHIGSKAIENMIVFSICDHGVGMTNEQIAKVLSEDINERSKGTAGEHGSGLGLSLCFSFVKKHNGQISAVSSPGKGSTFYLHLPLSKHHKIDSENVERPVACWIKKHILK